MSTSHSNDQKQHFHKGKYYLAPLPLLTIFLFCTTQCVTSEKPLDFIYEKSTNSYRLDLYNSTEKLVEKIQTGKGDPSLYPGTTYLYIDGIFS